VQSYGNATPGYMSPNTTLIQGSLNEPCIAVDDVSVPLLDLVPIQNVPILRTT
jgi:hypothetical protein